MSKLDISRTFSNKADAEAYAQRVLSCWPTQGYGTSANVIADASGKWHVNASRWSSCD